MYIYIYREREYIYIYREREKEINYIAGARSRGRESDAANQLASQTNNKAWL
jgi:hypothetical protein